MQLFIDTANLEEIRTAAAWGVLRGVTTNPSLIAKEGKDLTSVLTQIASMVDGPISAEVLSSQTDGILAEARELSKIHSNIVIKIPISEEGLAAVAALEKEGIRTNVTLIFSAAQALLAANAGATYVSPFIGRLDDISDDGADAVSEIVQIFTSFGMKTKVIAASIRGPRDVVQAALAGAEIATVPFSVLKKMVHHPLTDIGIVKFNADWEKTQNK